MLISNKQASFDEIRTVQRHIVASLEVDLLSGELVVRGSEWDLCTILLAQRNSLETRIKACGVGKLLKLHTVDARGIPLDRGSCCGSQVGENEGSKDCSQHGGGRLERQTQTNTGLYGRASRHLTGT